LCPKFGGHATETVDNTNSFPLREGVCIKSKKVADAGEPPVVIPVIVVTVDIHVALVAIAVESEMYVLPSITPSLEYSRD
jgi:hypothetical protein